MKNTILNLGVVISKEQQKSINGGSGKYCQTIDGECSNCCEWDWGENTPVCVPIKHKMCSPMGPDL